MDRRDYYRDPNNMAERLAALNTRDSRSRRGSLSVASEGSGDVTVISDTSRFGTPPGMSPSYPRASDSYPRASDSYSRASDSYSRGPDPVMPLGLDSALPRGPSSVISRGFDEPVRPGPYRPSSSPRGPGSVVSMSRGGGGGPGSVVSTATTNAGPDGEAFWPDLRRTLTSDAALRNLTLVCPVCTTSMRAQASSSRNQAKILHCGHMLCDQCTTRIVANMDNPAHNPHARAAQCPFCKAPLGKYPFCGESCQSPGKVGFPMPRDMEEMRHFPRTMPEGGSNPACCKRCRLKRIERLSRKLVRVLVNDDIARAMWQPTMDEARQAQDEVPHYVVVPELQHFLDAVASAATDEVVYQKYTQLYPPANHFPQAHAEMADHTRIGS